MDIFLRKWTVKLSIAYQHIDQNKILMNHANAAVCEGTVDIVGRLQFLIDHLHLEEGRTYKSITAEYGISKASISKWCSKFSEECQLKADINPNTPNEAELMKENLRLHKELEESQKEIPLWTELFIMLMKFLQMKRT